MDYEIIHTKRRSVGIRVTPQGKVIIRAPHRMSKKSIEEIVEKHHVWIENRLNKLSSTPSITYTATKEEINNLKEKTKEIVLPLVEKHASLMGVTPTKINFTSAKRVFGSCTSQKHLNFSFRLCLYPVEAVEYVVVHELAHILQMNHSKKFWAVVENRLPDYKKRKELLKEIL